MLSEPSVPKETNPDSRPQSSEATDFGSYEGIDLRDLLSRFLEGIVQTVGLGLLGLALGAIIYFGTSRSILVSTTTHVAFSFPGLERGQYPDKSKFQPDDLRAPSVITAAIRRQGLDPSTAFQARVEGAVTVEGFIPAEIIKARDRLRAAGQITPPYVSDEYAVTLSLPRDFPLSRRQREILLNDIVSVYLENFQHTYAEAPQTFGNAFVTLRGADFPDYELILNKELENISIYLNQQREKSPTYRSPSTHFSFGDLIEQTALFNQIHLNETLGIIYLNGLSRDRSNAMLKMNYYLQTLADKEAKAEEEDKLVNSLLEKARNQAQNYVLGIKSSATQPRQESPIIDQGLIDSLLANDAYTFLVHQALETGMKLKALEADRAQLLERHKRMESFIQENAGDQSALRAQVQKSLIELESYYAELISNIRRTDADFERQQFADAIRFSSGVQTEGDISIRGCMISAVAGAGIGIALGLGLCLLGVSGKSISAGFHRKQGG